MDMKQFNVIFEHYKYSEVSSLKVFTKDYPTTILIPTVAIWKLSAAGEFKDLFFLKKKNLSM